jgi:hypothetical protein
MNDDLKLEEAYQNYWKLTVNLIENGNRPLSVAGVMLAQALSIYKTILKPNEFEMMIDTISDSRDDVKIIKIETNLQ